MFCPLVELKMETVSDVNVLSSMPVENVMTISALDGTLVAPPTGEVELHFRAEQARFYDIERKAKAIPAQS